MENEYLTVSALTQYLKRKFDVDPYLRKVYLTGEISNFRQRPRHQYFSLKDEHAIINVTMFESDFDKIKFKPTEGMKVLICGQVTLYGPQGKYQIIAKSMEPDGVGALYQAYEQLKEKLRKEGAFDKPKRPIAQFPKRIAVITSPSGAVIRDIITTVNRRYPIVQLVLFPAQVQGDAAADTLVKRLKEVNERGDFDTIIIGRGGGSIEDLWPFNEEKVARAIYNSKIPVISSVGHETDTTIADMVADLRVATPTAAAEQATPVLTDVISNLKNEYIQIIHATRDILTNKRQMLDVYRNSYIFKEPQDLYQSYIQRVDQLKTMLIESFKNDLRINKHQYQMLQQKLIYQTPDIAGHQDKVKDLLNQLINNYQIYLKEQQHKMIKLTDNLDNLSPLKTLHRGYATVSQDQKLVTSVKQLKPTQNLEIGFYDGKACAKIIKTEENK